MELALEVDAAEGVTVRNQFPLEEVSLHGDLDPARARGEAAGRKAVADRLHVNSEARLPPQEFDKFVLGVPQVGAAAPSAPHPPVHLALRGGPVRALLLFADAAVAKCDEVTL